VVLASDGETQRRGAHEEGDDQNQSNKAATPR
jgi:hypothetical protein